MRISDWSSDVCSSDLPSGGHDQPRQSMQGSYRPATGRPTFADTSLGARIRMGFDRSLLSLLRRTLVAICLPALLLAACDQSPEEGSEERRVGKECVSTFSSGGSPDL